MYVFSLIFNFDCDEGSNWVLRVHAGDVTFTPRLWAELQDTKPASINQEKAANPNTEEAGSRNLLFI